MRLGLTVAGCDSEASLCFGNCVKLILLNKFALNACALPDRAMTRLVAILVILFLVIPAKADVTLRPVPGWTVIQVYGLIKPADVRSCSSSYTENVNPDATLVILSSRGGYLAAGIDIGMRVRLKKLMAGVMGPCA